MSSMVVRWKDVPGAAKLKKRLMLIANVHGIFQCPIGDCEHEGFRSQRGCRKHVTNSHPWFFYFDEYPKDIMDDKAAPQNTCDEKTNESKDGSSNIIPDDVIFSETFAKWMCSSTGGARTKAHANQICSRVLKFIQYSQDDLMLEGIEGPKIDYYLASMACLSAFLQHLEDEKSIGFAGSVSYINALLETMEYRKFKGVSASILSNFSVAEVFLKRARRCIARKMRVQWTVELDVDTLERKGHWASLKDLQKVIPFHMGRYKKIVAKCREHSAEVSASDLTFSTRFITTFLFLRVKGSRPMTYQFLTIGMLRSAAKNGGYVDQKKFKTADKYGFDSMVIDDVCMHVLDDYVRHVRPRFLPKCEYLLLTRNGTKFTKLSQAMCLLVYEAIGKYVHPTRYRQIIETESADVLSLEEQELISQDQKHTSNVARIHYRKKRSRVVAEKGNHCIKKLRGETGEQLDSSLKKLVNVSMGAEDSESDSDIFITQSSTKPVAKTDSDCQMTSIRKRITPFTEKEDLNLIKGINKHGYGKWGKILSDPSLCFAEGRARNSLLRHVRSNQFRCMYEKLCGKVMS
eukprot:gene17891-biopygen2671